MLHQTYGLSPPQLLTVLAVDPKLPCPLSYVRQAFIGGCYIGFGGLLSMVIAGQIPSSDPGTQTFVFAALFPVNLLLILLTGGSLYTGNTAAMPAVNK